MNNKDGGKGDRLPAPGFPLFHRQIGFSTHTHTHIQQKHAECSCGETRMTKRILFAFIHHASQFVPWIPILYLLFVKDEMRV